VPAENAHEGKKRVLIGIPGFHGIVPRAQKALLSLLFWCGRRMPDYEFCVEIVTKREQFRARNLLITAAVSEQCDYLLMLDDDMIPPPDLVQQLLAHQKPVVGCLYWQRGGSYHPVIMREYTLKGDLKKFKFLDASDPIITEKPGLHPVDIIGGGCMFFDVKVFEQLLKPYFWWEHELGTDISICFRLREAGIPIHVDTSIEIPHVDDEGSLITRRTIPRYARVIGEVKERYWDDLKSYLGMTDEQLLDGLYEAKGEAVRRQLWLAQPRETWEQVRSYYQEGEADHVLNLGYFNLQDDPARNYVLSEIAQICPKGGMILDYGCGNGFLSLALAQQGFTVEALDLHGAPTMAFVNWRIMRHLAAVMTVEFEGPVPERPTGMEGLVDGAVMISVLDHAWDPWGALQWVTEQVKPGGFLILDNYNTRAHPNEPQHLCRFDALTFVRDLEALGWRHQPESPYLFLRES
jgi:2-polyprenyl-3-methyl-5-hydroxy-6-metoxy-1,4-benzoquinol methylase